MRQREEILRAVEGASGILLGTLLLLSALVLPAAEAPGASQSLAEVDGEVITLDEVEKAIGAPLAKLQEQIYTLKHRKVEMLIADRLLAKEAAKRGITVQELLDTEVSAKVEPTTEQEIENDNQANMPRVERNEAKVREQIKTNLQDQTLAARRQVFLRSLRSQSKVVIHLQAPPPFRAEVRVDGAPFKGPATAPVTLVEFSDFHCPFCKRVQPTLDRLLARYGDQVKLVYRDFPIDPLHPQARKAHEAARCANDDGKFWAYHDLLYANAPKASPADLKAFAREVGLNLAAFERCVSSGKFQAAVQHDVEEGTRAGVTGTPTFFINRKMLAGAQSLESFVRAIEEELARAQ